MATIMTPPDGFYYELSIIEIGDITLNFPGGQIFYQTMSRYADTDFFNYIYTTIGINEGIEFYSDRNCTRQIQLNDDLALHLTSYPSSHTYDIYGGNIYVKAMNPVFKIKRGLQKNLPTTINEGTIYITTDYPNVYIDVATGKRISILPPWTEADEGKVLAIVDGKLTWVNQFDDFD